MELMNLPDAGLTLITFCFPHKYITKVLFSHTWKIKNGDVHRINRISWIEKNNHHNSPVPIDWVFQHWTALSSPLLPICYSPSGAPPLTHSLSSIRVAAHALPHHLSAATSSSSFSSPAAVNSRIPVCDSVHPLLFFLPSVRPSLSFMCAPLSSPARSGLPASSHALFVGCGIKWAKNNHGYNGRICIL